MKRELTLCLLKPTLVKNPIAVKHVQCLLEDRKFEILCNKKVTLTEKQSREFYSDHSSKFFFNRLITYICSGPIIVQVLARENAIQIWRELMGPTQVFKGIYTHPNTIRSIFGLSDTRNGTHGSGIQFVLVAFLHFTNSVKTANSEIKYFFPEFSIENWYKNEKG